MIHSLQAGGMERVVSELSNHFVGNEEIDVHIILYGIKRDIFYPINKNIKIHKPPFKFDNSRRIISTLKTISFLRKKIKVLKPDVVLSFGEYWNNLVLLATYGLNIPIFIADRSTPLKDLGRVQNILRKNLYPTATGLILQTEKAKQIYQKQYKSLNINVIGNPIREIEIKDSLKRENIVLMVGRLIQTKHQDRLIKIFSKINKPDWKLVIVGDNAKKQSNKEKLSKFIKKLNLKERVILAGNQKDVDKYFLKSKIFAFTSSSEGFPNVIGEAMSAGLPVVAYDCLAGPSEIISDNEDGFLISLFDDEEFQEKVEFLMNEDNLRQEMGNKAKNNIRKFETSKISDVYLKVILNKI